MRSNIYVVEDDLDVLKVMQEALRTEGYRVTALRDIFQAKAELRKAMPDLLVLDVNLPDDTGLNLCQALRQEPRAAGLPILFVTGKKSLTDKVLGLKMGGDDYLTKPFEVPEFLARVEALLRRARPEAASSSLSEGALRLDLAAHQAYWKDKPLKLWPKEFALVEVFLRAKGHMLTRQHIYEAVWGTPYEGNTRQVDFLVHRLRSRIACLKDRIVSVRGLGYRFDPAE